MKKIIFLIYFLLTLTAGAQKKDYPIQPVAFTHVHVELKTQGRIDNFLAAAGKRENKVCSEFPFDDTDVYKWLEGASYAMQAEPNPKLAKFIDSLLYI